MSLLNRPEARHLDYYDTDTLVALTDTLPGDACLRYPFPFLQIMFYMLLSDNRVYRLRGERMMTRMRAHFESSPEPYSRRILGEMIVISWVTGFARFQPLEQAAVLLDGHPSVTLRASDPFTFGLPMLLYSEFLKPGTLDDTVKRCQYNPYELVTDGFGRGAERLIMAEAALLRCNMGEAQIYARQAIDSAAEKQQYCIMASGYFTLMRRALYVSDTEQAVTELAALRALLPQVLELPGETRRMPTKMMRQTIALAECFFATTLRQEEQVPTEFLNGNVSALMMAGFGIPLVYSALVMLHTGNCVGAERMCLELDRLPTICQCTRLYSLIVTALAREKLYGTDKGLESLKTALAQAQADGILLPFAENPELLPMLKKLPANQFTCVVMEQCRNANKVTLKQSIKLLTDRELEVLQLIAIGKTRSEVATVLGVKDNTIKMHLSSIYSKLGASGKTDAIRIARTKEIL